MGSQMATIAFSPRLVNSITNEISRQRCLARLATRLTAESHHIILTSQVNHFCGRLNKANVRSHTRSSKPEAAFSQSHLYHVHNLSPQNHLVGDKKLPKSVAAQLVQKWVRHLERKDEPGRPPVMCLICLEEKHLQDAEILKRVAWTSAYLFRNNLRNVILIGFDKRLQNTPYNFEKLPHKLAGELFKYGAYSHVFLGANNPLSGCLQSSDIGIAEDLVDEALLTETIPIFTNVLDSSIPNRSVIGDLMNTTEVVARCVQPYRMLFVDPTENLRQQTLAMEIFPKATWSTELFEESGKLTDISKLLHALADLNAVSVVSPSNIVPELQQPGKGTFITKTEKINVYSSLDQVDILKLEDILTSSFNKRLKKDYFDRIYDKVETIYVSENYNAATIILRHKEVSVSYLDKIAVHPKAQGQGLNLAMWRQIYPGFQKLFWRSRLVNNHANQWYNKISQGFWKLDGKWVAYWYGLDSKEEIPELLNFLSDVPVSFEE